MLIYTLIVIYKYIKQLLYLHACTVEAPQTAVEYFQRKECLFDIKFYSHRKINGLKGYIYIYITQQRDIYDTVIFRFLQIFYGLTMKQKV